MVNKNTPHVYPVGDSQEHVIDEECSCWCNPCIEDGDFGEIVIHHAADKRELSESGRHYLQ